MAVQQPAVLEYAGMPAISGSRDMGLALSGAKVLVVDDDPDACELVRVVLEENGAEVFATTSPVEAFEHFREDKPNVVVADIIMPEESGYQLIKRIRSHERSEGGAEIPAVALTAKARVEDRLDALAAGFQVHVPKPVEPSELEAIIVNLLEKDQKVH